MQLFYQPGIPENLNYLDPDESHHCVNVLRKNKGDLIDLTDGKGSFYKARLTNADPGKCEFGILEEQKVKPPGYYIHIAIAPTKNQVRLEWFIEKCTEIGIDEVSFFISSNSEKKFIKFDRLLKKTISAMKQSLKAWLPRLKEPVALSEFFDSLDSKTDKFIAYFDPENEALLFREAKMNRRYCVLIGPEGDFTGEELELADSKNFKKVNLGPGRLRSETAGIVACHTLHLVNSQA